MIGAPKSIAKLSDIRVQVEGETDRMLKLARTVGKRLRHYLHQTADTRSLPDDDWRETAKWYSRTVIELKRFLAAQPADRPGKPEMDSADYEAEIRIITVEKLRGATPEELERMLAEAKEPARPARPALPMPDEKSSDSDGYA